MPSPAYAWYVVAVLLLAYTLSFIDRMILSLLVGPIRADLGISDLQMSLLMGFAFAVFYSALGIPLGWLADRTSIPFVFQVCSYLPLIGLLTCLLPNLEQRRQEAI